jgi:hypothetical protein
VVNCRVLSIDRADAIRAKSNSIVAGCVIDSNSDGVALEKRDSICANCVVRSDRLAIATRSNNIIIGNRVISTDVGIFTVGVSSDIIVANNRISATNSAITDNASGTLLDSNLTGPSN